MFKQLQHRFTDWVLGLLGIRLEDFGRILRYKTARYNLELPTYEPIYLGPPRDPYERELERNGEWPGTPSPKPLAFEIDALYREGANPFQYSLDAIEEMKLYRVCNWRPAKRRGIDYAG